MSSARRQLLAVRVHPAGHHALRHDRGQAEPLQVAQQAVLPEGDLLDGLLDGVGPVAAAARSAPRGGTGRGGAARRIGRPTPPAGVDHGQGHDRRVGPARDDPQRHSPSVGVRLRARTGPRGRAQRRCVRLEEDGAGAARGHLVAGVVQRARLEAQAAAADAAVELVAQPLDPLDLLVEPRPPGAAEPGPVGLGRRAVLGKGGEGLADLVEAEADPLRGADEREPAQRRLLVAALVARRAHRADQAPGLVEPDRRGGEPRPLGQVSDGQLCHVLQSPLT